MRKSGFLLTIVFLLCRASIAVAQVPTHPNGTLLEQTPCESKPTVSYEQYVEASQRRYAEEVKAAKYEGFSREVPRNLAAHLVSKSEFDRRTAYAGFECRRIKYLSDGLKVVGFIWKPENTGGKKLPLIIYNRGGTREFGKITPWKEFGHYYYLSNGFVVIASQYRGNDGGEGSEEFGGADVRDVLNLIPLARSLGYVDMNNVFMLGWSRGGMMAYLALKGGMRVNAAAVGGGLTDLRASAKSRPEFAAIIFRQVIPDFDKRGEERMRERSALYWAEKINVPLLILHGATDWRAETGSQALAFAQKLQELGKVYELVIYARDDHGLTLHRKDSDRKIVEWFKAHMK